MIAWRKSSYSSESFNCVQVTTRPGLVLVRDSKAGVDGPVLTFPAAAWSEFVAALKDGSVTPWCA